MWLPETAVDLETLDILAEYGIHSRSWRLTRPTGCADRRRRVAGCQRRQIDPTMAYLCSLPSGRTISLFFYDGPISRAVAFEGLLDNGRTFANRLLAGLRRGAHWPQLVHIATDGETYGHHHRYGDMALAYALQYHRDRKLCAHLTNYGEFLEKHPPTHRGGNLREYLLELCPRRGALAEQLRLQLAAGTRAGTRTGGRPCGKRWIGSGTPWLPLYERRAPEFLKDPWAARNDYIDVILDRTAGNWTFLLERHASGTLTPTKR